MGESQIGNNDILVDVGLPTDNVPLGSVFGDPTHQEMATSRLHNGELPSGNLRLWREMQRVLSSMYDNFSTDFRRDKDTRSLQHRMLQSDSLLVTWLIGSGHLQRMTELKMQSLKERGAVGDEEDLRLELCVDFINRIRLRNKEDDQFDNKYFPTIGIELEFLYKNDPDHPEKSFNPLDYYKARDKLKPMNPPYDYHLEGKNALEYSLNPSASYKSQLREILLLSKLKLHPSKFFSPHITIGGLELTEDKTEAIYIQSIVFGCGFSVFSKDDIQRREDRGKFRVKYAEKHPKFSQAGEFHMPFLLNRASHEIVPYGQKHTTNGGDVHGVEFRLGNRFNSFGNFTREVDAIYHLSAAALAYQKPESERDQVETKLAQIWQELKRSINEIYLQIGINFEPGIQKSFTPGWSWRAPTQEEIGSAPYASHLFEIGYQSATDESFRSKIRVLVQNARREILEVTKK